MKSPTLQMLPILLHKSDSTSQTLTDVAEQLVLKLCDLQYSPILALLLRVPPRHDYKRSERGAG